MSPGRVAIQKWVKKWYHRLVSTEDTYLSSGKLTTELERAAACVVASFPQANLTQDDMYKVMADYHATFRNATGVPFKGRTRKPKAGQPEEGQPEEGQPAQAPKEPAAKLFPLSTLTFTYI
jgi:hypothetical protein